MMTDDADGNGDAVMVTIMMMVMMVVVMIVDDAEW